MAPSALDAIGLSHFTNDARVIELEHVVFIPEAGPELGSGLLPPEHIDSFDGSLRKVVVDDGVRLGLACVAVASLRAAGRNRQCLGPHPRM